MDENRIKNMLIRRVPVSLGENEMRPGEDQLQIQEIAGVQHFEYLQRCVTEEKEERCRFRSNEAMWRVVFAGWMDGEIL